MFYVKATINEKVIIWTKNHSYSSIEGMWNSKKQQWEAMSEEEVIEIIKRIKSTEPNVGKVIGLTVKEVGNRFDKSKIAVLVQGV